MRYLLLDLNGTIHVGDTPTPGALAALEKLQKASHGGEKFKVRFCSEYCPRRWTAVKFDCFANADTAIMLLSQLICMTRQLIQGVFLFPHISAAKYVLPSFADTFGRRFHLARRSSSPLPFYLKWLLSIIVALTVCSRAVQGLVRSVLRQDGSSAE